MLRLHPDRHPGDPDATERFRALVRAWEVLGDPSRRAAYDDEREAPPEPDSPTRPVRELFGAVLDAAFGVADHRPSPGRDLRYHLELSLAEVARGATRTLSLPTIRPCATCAGRGFPPGTVPSLCNHCAGTGEVRRRPALRATRERCPTCAGRGYLPNPPCPSCRGAGVEATTRAVDVSVPAGTRHGAHLLVRGAGEPGLHGGPPGDLIVACAVSPHPVLRQEGDDLVMDLTVSVLDALLGATVTVPTALGPHALRLPEGTQHGATLRLPGLGVASARAGRPPGDQLVRIRLRVPKLRAAEARAHLEAARDLLQRAGDDPSLPPQATGGSHARDP